jgi:hypothetical protein
MSAQQNRWVEEDELIFQRLLAENAAELREFFRFFLDTLQECPLLLIVLVLIVVVIIVFLFFVLTIVILIGSVFGCFANSY